MVPRAGIEPARILKVRRILSPVRLPVSPPGQHSLEVPTGLEPMITELQSVALPTWPWNRIFYFFLFFLFLLPRRTAFLLYVILAKIASLFYKKIIIFLLKINKIAIFPYYYYIFLIIKN